MTETTGIKKHAHYMKMLYNVPRKRNLALDYALRSIEREVVKNGNDHFTIHFCSGKKITTSVSSCRGGSVFRENPYQFKEKPLKIKEDLMKEGYKVGMVEELTKDVKEKMVPNLCFTTDSTTCWEIVASFPVDD